MSVHLHPRAEADLVAIGDWIAEDNPAAALRVISRITAAMATVAALPHMGRPSTTSAREWKVSNLPYVFVYHIVDDGILVTAIFHTAQERPR